MKIHKGDIVVKYVGTEEDQFEWILHEPIFVQLSNGHDLMIGTGYLTDFASVPRFLWSFISPIGQVNLPSIIHDFLYTEHIYNRKFADEEFLKWMDFLAPHYRFKNRLMYYAVRIFGQGRWNKYCRNESNK